MAVKNFVPEGRNVSVIHVSAKPGTDGKPRSGQYVGEPTPGQIRKRAIAEAEAKANADKNSQTA